MCRFVSLLALIGSLLTCVLNLRAASGVTEIPLTANALLYDSFTDKLYAAAADNLLQLDPLTGQILNSFSLGANVTLLASGADNGIWAALNGEHAIRRFNLATLSAEDKIVLPALDRGFFESLDGARQPPHDGADASSWNRWLGRKRHDLLQRELESRRSADQPAGGGGGATGVNGGRPRSTARLFATARSAIAVRVSRVALPRCGARTTFSRSRSPAKTSGSRS